MPTFTPIDDGYSVLIVDNDQTTARSLATYLRISTGYQVSVEFDAKAGVEAARRISPDVLICGVEPNYRNSSLFSRELLGPSLRTKALRIALSSQSDLADTLFQMGFDRYYLKPVVPVEIETAIRLHEFQLSLAAH